MVSSFPNLFKFKKKTVVFINYVTCGGQLIIKIIISYNVIYLRDKII